MTEDDKRPVLIVIDGKYLVHAGDPITFDKNLIAEYAQKGYQIKTITIKQYREKIGGWKWWWEKKSKVLCSNRNAISTSSEKPESPI